MLLADPADPSCPYTRPTPARAPPSDRPRRRAPRNRRAGLPGQARGPHGRGRSVRPRCPVRTGAGDRTGDSTCDARQATQALRIGRQLGAEPGALTGLRLDAFPPGLQHSRLSRDRPQERRHGAIVGARHPRGLHSLTWLTTRVHACWMLSRPRRSSTSQPRPSAAASSPASSRRSVSARAATYASANAASTRCSSPTNPHRRRDRVGTDQGRAAVAWLVARAAGSSPSRCGPRPEKRGPRSGALLAARGLL